MKGVVLNVRNSNDGEYKLAIHGVDNNTIGIYTINSKEVPFKLGDSVTLNKDIITSNPEKLESPYSLVEDHITGSFRFGDFSSGKIIDGNLIGYTGNDVLAEEYAKTKGGRFSKKFKTC